MLMLWPVGKDCFAAAALAVKDLMRLSYCEQALVGGDNLLALATSLQQPRQMPSRPRLSRSEIHASGIVILDRNSQASSTFLSSPCQSPMRVLAAIDDPRVVEKILRHLGAWHDPPARPPPQGVRGPHTYEPCDDVDPPPDYENVLTD